MFLVCLKLLTIVKSFRYNYDITTLRHCDTGKCYHFILSQVEIRPMMYVALTYDHRLIDGREAVTFLRKIKSVVEDPRVLLLDM